MRNIYWLSFLLLVSLSANAQLARTDVRDSADEQQAYVTAVQVYHHYLTPENGLYNGGEYADYTASLTHGQPYFGIKENQPGWVLYNGMRYDSLMLWYDLVTDAVVTWDPDHVLRFQLINDRLQAFNLSGHLFIRFQKDSLDGIRTGFYEVLATGRVNLYKKSSKNLQTYATQDGLQKDIFSDSSFYIARNGRFLPVNKKSSVLAALADKKTAVRAFIRKNHLSIRREKEYALLSVVTYYNGLTP